jgi:hypothetical protein
MGRSRGSVSPSILAINTSSSAAIPARADVMVRGGIVSTATFIKVKELPQINDNTVRSPTSSARLICALSLEASGGVAAFSLRIVILSRTFKFIGSREVCWLESDFIPWSGPISATHVRPAELGYWRGNGFVEISDSASAS